MFYFMRPGRKAEISTDFIELAKKHTDEITLNKKARDFYISCGLFMPGETYFNEIRRVRIGYALVITDDGKLHGEIRLPMRHMERHVTKDIFREGLVETIRLYAPKNNEYLLFSGGRDSALLALLLKHEVGADVEYIMGLAKGAKMLDDFDAKIDFYSNYFGKDIIEINVDQDDYSFDDIRYLVKDMPLTAHNSTGYDAMCAYVQERGGRCWTGQDADSMYALGYTDGTIREVLARMLISDGYIKSLDDIRGAKAWRFVGSVFSAISNKKSHAHMRPAKNINELRDCIFKAYASVPIVDMQKAPVLRRQKKLLTLEQAKRTLYLDKMSFYITGRDHRVITYAGHLKRRTVYPYSSAMMFFICADMKRGMGEAFVNKKWISELIRYYIGSKAFKKLYPVETFKNSRIIGDYEKNILNSTNFGRSLKRETGYSGENFHEALALAWEKELLAEVGI